MLAPDDSKFAAASVCRLEAKGKICITQNSKGQDPVMLCQGLLRDYIFHNLDWVYSLWLKMNFMIGQRVSLSGQVKKLERTPLF